MGHVTCKEKISIAIISVNQILSCFYRLWADENIACLPAD